MGPDAPAGRMKEDAMGTKAKKDETRGPGRPPSVGADARLEIRIPFELKAELEEVLQEGETTSTVVRAALERLVRRRRGAR